MKIILQILLLIFVINLNSFAQSVDLQKGLVAYYPFDGNAEDKSGNGNTGLVNGATLTSDRNGNSNAAYNFANTSDYIKIPLTSKKFENDYSISCWVIFDNFSINYPSIIVGDKNFIALHGQGSAYKNQDQEKVVFYQDNSTKQAENRIVKPILTEKLKTNTFYHITVVKSAEKCTIYLNGVKQSEGNVKKSAMIYGSYIRIGNAFRQSTNRCLKGKVDDVFIYNRVLNDAEIAELYQGEAAEIVLEKAEVVVSKKEAARLAKNAKKVAAAKNKEEARLAKIAKQKEANEEKEIARLAKEKADKEAIVKQEEVEKEKEIVEVTKEKVDKEIVAKQEEVEKEKEVAEVVEEKTDKKVVVKQEDVEKEEEVVTIVKQDEVAKQNKGEYVFVSNKKNCKVWRPYPLLNSTVKWKGKCINGFVEGKGTLTWYVNDEKKFVNEGFWEKGKMQGEGIVHNNPKTKYYDSARFYKLSLKDGYKNGYCEEYFTQGQSVYFKGYYKNDKKEGKGLNATQDFTFEGEYVNDKPVKGLYKLKRNYIHIVNKSVTYSAPCKMEGFFNEKYNLEGQGKITLNDGTTYEGEFTDGVSNELQSFLEAKKTNSFFLYRKYLNSYPNGYFITQVNTILTNREDQAFQEAKEINTIKSFNNFIRNFPNSRYLDDIEFLKYNLTLTFFNKKIERFYRNEGKVFMEREINWAKDFQIEIKFHKPTNPRWLNDDTYIILSTNDLACLIKERFHVGRKLRIKKKGNTVTFYVTSFYGNEKYKKSITIDCQQKAESMLFFKNMSFNHSNKVLHIKASYLPEEKSIRISKNTLQQELNKANINSYEEYINFFKNNNTNFKNKSQFIMQSIWDGLYDKTTNGDDLVAMINMLSEFPKLNVKEAEINEFIKIQLTNIAGKYIRKKDLKSIKSSSDEWNRYKERSGFDYDANFVTDKNSVKYLIYGNIENNSKFSLPVIVNISGVIAGKGNVGGLIQRKEYGKVSTSFIIPKIKPKGEVPYAILVDLKKHNTAGTIVFKSSLEYFLANVNIRANYTSSSISSLQQKEQLKWLQMCQTGIPNKEGMYEITNLLTASYKDYDEASYARIRNNLSSERKKRDNTKRSMNKTYNVVTRVASHNNAFGHNDPLDAVTVYTVSCLIDKQKCIIYLRKDNKYEVESTGIIWNDTYTTYQKALDAVLLDMDCSK